MSDIALLLIQLDQAYDHRSWHGTNLRGSIRGLTPEAAAWRPAPGRHNIHELVVHAAYWKYAVWRRLTGEPRGAFPFEGSNWFPREGADAAQWRADVRLLADTHRRLRDAVAALDPRALTPPMTRGRETPLSLISGIIAHDLYHAGQIQLVKRLRDAR
jgi:uncharacterized damage-inducible protein DinB